MDTLLVRMRLRAESMLAQMQEERVASTARTGGQRPRCTLSQRGWMKNIQDHSGRAENGVKKTKQERFAA
jgi:hypothetical protein